MSEDGLSPVERQTYLDQIEQLRRQNVVPTKGLLDLYGYTETGDFILAPNSFSRGYIDAFLLPTQRPYLTFNFLGLFGQLSDGSWIFVPSYNRGLSYGTERQTTLKFGILAEGQKRLFREFQAQFQSQSRTQTELKEALERIKELEEQLKRMRDE